ncbi:carboxypeptidase family protein [Neolewinella xylanilytica]|uniref:Carboxypeptidase family protein n=1 Tax=Neolewinella xylanilytica TaxID=1514080 RepID=A0A2S6I567_9BACT|nr:outer membrane beta-barrel protein [Neolewinella xylanilytica]PPK86323.1 carboxypeptidase family protein [Neolewinella xylanilytica]
MRHLLFICFCILGASLWAQSDISATVVDTTGTTLPGANAILLRTSDTLLTSFGTTDNKGVFLMEKVPAGDYLLRVTFLGYERPDQEVTVSESDQYLGLGEIVLYPSGYELSGVQVTADRIPIRMKGDTMLYDAAAFAVGENAKVEDLLRRLPGMSIDANGQLTWRGKPVQEVMINGKPFFAGNSSLVTQNLDAKALKNIEVFDQKTDSEEISGIDDGEENTTVNLEMNEEFKAKLFGELYAGSGVAAGDDDPRYDAGGKLFRISDATQLGLLGTINNVNRVGFSGDELMSFNQNSGRGGYFSTGGGLPYYDGGQTPGQNRSIAAGVNFGKTVGENGQLTLDYTLFDRQQTQVVTERQAFTRADNERTVLSDQTDASSRYSHRIGFEYEHELDTVSRFRVEGSGQLAGNDNLGSAVTVVTNDQGDSQTYTVEEFSEGQVPSGDIDLRYNRRLPGKAGRTFGANAEASYGEDQTDLVVEVDGLEDTNGEVPIPGSLQNGTQVQNRRTNSTSVGAEVDYTEPLSEKIRWETELGFGHDRDEGDYRFRLDEGRETENLLTRGWTSYRGGTNLLYRFGDRNNFQIGADFEQDKLDISGDTSYQRDYTFVLPSARFRIQAGKANLYLNYNANAQAPSVNQLQTIARPSVTGRVSVGNPDLDPAVRHSVWSGMWFNDQFRALSINANVGGDYTDNAFGNSLTFTSNQQIYQTVNVSHAWGTNAYVGTVIGMAFMNGELRANGQVNGSIGQGFVDGVARTNISRNTSGTVDITTELNEKSFLKAGYTYAHSINSFDDEESVDIVTVTHDIVTQFELEISPKWRLETQFLYRIFEEASFAAATNIPDLQAAIEIRPFKKAGHYFRIIGRDLLNNNLVINRQAQAFVTTETQSNGLGQYFLATFNYQL